MDDLKEIPNLPAYKISRSGDVYSFKKSKVKKLRPTKTPKGYLRINLSTGERIRGRNFAVHRLVLLTFVGPAPEKHQCCHLNGNPSDNRIENLIWGTCAENHKHITIHGTKPRGVNHPRTTLSEEDIIRIRTVSILGHHGNTARLAKEYNVTKRTIQGIVKRHTWGHVLQKGGKE